jgi:signal transduction histidine kinase/CHASE3 domain sensor protein
MTASPPNPSGPTARTPPAGRSVVPRPPQLTRTRRLLTALTPAVIVVVLGALVVDGLGRVRTTAALVTHTREVRETIGATLSDLLDAETGQRGFIITGTDRYLEPYDAGLARLTRDTGRLRALTRENPTQQRWLDSLGPLIATKRTMLDSAIAARRASGLAAATGIISNDAGRVAMDRIRGVLAQMMDEEERLLAPRIVSAGRRGQAVAAIVIVGTLVAGVLALVAHGLLSRYGAAQAAAADLLDRKNAELETQNAPLGEQALELELQRQQLQDQAMELETQNEQLQSQTVELELQQEHLQNQTAELETQTIAAKEAAAELEIANDDLRHSEARLRLATEIAALGTWDLDPVSHALVWDERCRQAYGVPPGAKVDFNVFLDRLHPEDRDRVQAAVGAALDPDRANGDGTRMDIEYRTIGIDGVTRWVRSSGRGFFSEPHDGDRRRALRFTGTVLDVTAQHDAQAERDRLLESERAARTDAERANRAKSEFLTTMSHELRTPLNAIGGYVELIAMGIRGAVTPEQLEDLARVKRSGQHLLSLINDILNFAKLEAGQVEFRPAPTPVAAMLDELETLLAPLLQEKQLAYDYRPCAEPLVARADPEKVRQIFINLLSNATKFTDPGGRIRVECASDESKVIFRVIDTGRGIPADQLERIFEPFVQISRQSTPSSQQGVGLGLAISRDLARRMDGDLTVTSEVGVGSTFTITLPRIVEGATRASAAHDSVTHD